MRSRGSWTRRARAAAVVGMLPPLAGLGLALAPTASAHDELVSSSPDDGARVTAPRALTLTYSESLVDTGFRVVVRGPDGPVDGEVELSGARLVDRFSAPLSPGSYDVVWRVVSADGHPISGRMSFTVRAAATPSTTSESTSASPSSTATSSAPSPSASSSTPAAGPTNPESGRGGLALGVALVAAVAVAVAAAVTRRVRGPRA